MPKATFLEPGGARRDVDVPVGQSLMKAATSNGVDGILGDCGGVLSCATCHVVVLEPHASRLEPPSADERSMLEFTAAPREAASRLCCQIAMRDELDGIVVRVAATQA